jgi:hypothetical protein
MLVPMPPLRPAVVLLCAAVATLAACRAPRVEAPYGTPLGTPAARTSAPGELLLDRGDWLVGDQSALFKVLLTPEGGARPVHAGFVVQRRYREVRGGPVFTMHEVTTLDRDEQVGLVDSLGNAKRFVPRRGGGIDVVPVGNNPSLEANVGAIFQEVRPVVIERTTERRVAFEMLDADRDGYVTLAEWPPSRRGSDPDTNGDGRVDWQEFDAVDRL